jgi:hypothetical protein
LNLSLFLLLAPQSLALVVLVPPLEVLGRGLSIELLGWLLTGSELCEVVGVEVGRRGGHELATHLHVVEHVLHLHLGTVLGHRAGLVVWVVKSHHLVVVTIVHALQVSLVVLLVGSTVVALEVGSFSRALSLSAAFSVSALESHRSSATSRRSPSLPSVV